MSSVKPFVNDKSLQHHLEAVAHQLILMLRLWRVNTDKMDA